jgi:D-glycero-alpha-D-manno-heptose-7-phosphate kinase
MIISKTPFRISFFGGGTDYPEWFRENGGSVIAATINKFCHISIRKLPPFFEHKHRIVYSKIELVNKLNEIEHPVVRAILEEKNLEGGMEIHHFGDLPARSGLGSSSSFTVGLLNAIYALEGRMVAKDVLARGAIHVEHELLAENVGWQDQISAAFGGLNRIDFSPSGKFSVTPIIVPHNRIEELESSIMLFFTGLSRYATDVAKETVENIKTQDTQLGTLHKMVDEAINILQSANSRMDEFGEMMHESWKIKRALASNISNPQIDEIYEAAISAGASGGKVMGAGGGGFMVFIVPPENRRAVRTKLSSLIQVSCKLEFQGSEISVYNPSNSEQSVPIELA